MPIISNENTMTGHRHAVVIPAKHDCYGVEELIGLGNRLSSAFDEARRNSRLKEKGLDLGDCVVLTAAVGFLYVSASAGNGLQVVAVQKPQSRQRYLFAIEGLRDKTTAGGLREIWSKPAYSEKEAHQQVWDELTENEKNCVVIFDWIDTACCGNHE